jgi:HPt (histidine-containing phosphotransfer) domain-containing protein
VLRLQNALGGGDFSAARAIGHSLAGSGGSYGFEEITRIGRAIEENSRSGDVGSLGRQIAQLEDYLSRVHPDFR